MKRSQHNDAKLFLTHAIAAMVQQQKQRMLSVIRCIVSAN